MGSATDGEEVMKTRHVLLLIAVAMVVLQLTPGLTHAASGKMGTAEGETEEPILDCEEEESSETADEDCVVEARWNPVITCNPAPDDDIFDLLGCLITSGSPGCQVGISTPEPPTSIGGSEQPVNIQQVTNDPDGCIVSHHTGNYLISPLVDFFGFSVFREDGTEIDHLVLLETIPGIRWTEIEVDQPGLVAIISGILERPAGGWLTVWLNDREFTISTFGYSSGGLLSRALAAAISANDFTVAFDRGTITVIRDNKTGGGLKRVGMEIIDLAIIRTQLALEPAADRDDLLDPLVLY
jgi:hypothetical protein